MPFKIQKFQTFVRLFIHVVQNYLLLRKIFYQGVLLRDLQAQAVWREQVFGWSLQVGHPSFGLWVWHMEIGPSSYDLRLIGGYRGPATKLVNIFFPGFLDNFFVMNMKKSGANRSFIENFLFDGFWILERIWNWPKLCWSWSRLNGTVFWSIVANYGSFWDMWVLADFLASLARDSNESWRPGDNLFFGRFGDWGLASQLISLLVICDLRKHFVHVVLQKWNQIDNLPQCLIFCRWLYSPQLIIVKPLKSSIFFWLPTFVQKTTKTLRTRN